MERKRDKVKSKLNKEYTLPQKIGIDILGVLLILGSGLFGWLPGPGGIPLLLAGLGLLSINHEWARRLLVSVKLNGVKVAETIFREHPLLMLTYDILAVLLLLGAGYIFGQETGSVIKGLATSLLFLGISIFLGNRKRLKKINAFVKRMTKKSQ